MMALQILKDSMMALMMADWTYWESNWVETRAREMDHPKALRMAPMRARLLDWWRRTELVKAPRMARQILME